MKISFYFGLKGKKFSDPEPIDVSYLYEGHLCSIIVYGEIKNPQIRVIDSAISPLPFNSKYWFFINISWSRVDGFKFNQYSDPEITTSLNSTRGALRGGDKIEVGKNLVTIIFKAQVNQEDLGTIDPKIFLEKCSQFGIRIVDTKISNLDTIYGLSCADCQLVNVEFFATQLEGANFSNASFNNVKFINSNLKSASFHHAKFIKVEFSSVDLTHSIFDRCVVDYNKQKIDNNEVLIFSDQCNLSYTSFISATLCSQFQKSNLSNANFSESTLVACKFYDCEFLHTRFVKTKFNSFNTQSQEKNTQIDDRDLITCCITTKEGQGAIKSCYFNHATMSRIRLSNYMIEDTDFESADLFRAKLSNCTFTKTNFHSITEKSASLKSANLSDNTFRGNCTFDRVDFSCVTMINSQLSSSSFVRASFYRANLRSSKFSKSDLRGVDFRYADLTLMNLDECQLDSANFFQTQRGGLNLNISPDSTHDGKSQEDKSVLMNSNCIFNYVEWSPKIDGEIQIEKQSFLQIISGKTSPVAVISSLSKEGAQFILNAYANAESSAKSAGEDLNDASINIGGDADDSSINGGNISTDKNGGSEAHEDEDEDDEKETTHNQSGDLNEENDETV
jgi:uncharacterized protein YjbI with pentapeptide repeats